MPSTGATPDRAIRAQPATLGGCPAPEQWLRYLDATASSPSREQVERHLDHCSSCRIVLAEAARDNFMSASTATEAAPSARTLVLGEKIGERYEVRRFIAKGGMGEVYEAFDLVLHEVVALKTLTLAISDQLDAYERMLTEVRAARRVTHPNVCRQFEFGIHRAAGRDRERVPFLTMELMEGRTLAAALAADGPLTEKRTRQILRDVATGLSAIHAAGIVHRDLKSENVFLTTGADGAPKAVVMDFGVALAPRTVLGRDAAGEGEGLVGTLDYMAPEQIQGLPASPASDIYSFGIIAFELLTGRLPFPRSSTPRTAALRLGGETPRLPTSIQRGSPWCNALLEKCLSLDPALRPRTAAEIVQMLDEVGRPTRRAVKVGAAGLLIVGLAIAMARGGSSPAPVSPRLVPGRAGKVGLPASAEVRRPAYAAEPTSSPSPPSPSPPPPPPLKATAALPPDVLPPTAMAPVKPRLRRPRSGAARATAPSSPEAPALPAAAGQRPPANIDPLAPGRPRPRHPDDLADPFAPAP